ncbi:hypothetical protein [Actinacidiphila sp. ITFR-21]|uniref:hypothetical protein n=1 Tax=Actinacidiphila sp. ITFR-21 TaxID=3075199 RepID=UPI00288BC6F1|nr:hypothetical protein [Streptomyces sp. ITFR-21]WNI17581.1 hypothetical protein RLT57_20035 [Streptomyces sp. ITFR-21]WNI17721.1 hypothetical protein RLT57_20750 [Streptomyces sp. ITFR-21]
MSTGVTSPSSPRTASLPLTGSATTGSLAVAPSRSDMDQQADSSFGFNAGLERGPTLQEFAHGAASTGR